MRESAGYPYSIQEYGHELWTEAEASPINTVDVDAVREIVTDSLARNFLDDSPLRPRRVPVRRRPNRRTG